MPITIPLLDSLLSSHPAEAEQHYHSIPLESRAVELTSILVQTSSAANSARSLLAATLLRRDLSTLNNDGVGGQIVEPLMVLFEGGTDAKTKRMVGRCVAELCGGEWIVHVLKRLEGGVSISLFMICVSCSLDTIPSASATSNSGYILTNPGSAHL